LYRPEGGDINRRRGFIDRREGISTGGEALSTGGVALSTRRRKFLFRIDRWQVFCGCRKPAAYDEECLRE
ncbi:hypothetical protein, partial [Virgibacillus alimentarius]|uniref:hypothetical protein n=1 Tax=Virgibacillus alimentarius TaxID=698769 RepID=UPI0018DC9574